MPIERPSDSSLIIGVAASTAERVHLARLLGGADALLLVSNADQARAFLELTGVTVAAERRDRRDSRRTESADRGSGCGAPDAGGA